MTVDDQISDFRREQVWLIFTRDDQLAQIAVYKRAPCVRTAVVTFIRRHQAYVREADLCFTFVFGDFKTDFGVIPLDFVLIIILLSYSRLKLSQICFKWWASCSVKIVIKLSFEKLFVPIVNFILFSIQDIFSITCFRV
jgi:hypothetical protein